MTYKSPKYQLLQVYINYISYDVNKLNIITSTYKQLDLIQQANPTKVYCHYVEEELLIKE